MTKTALLGDICNIRYGKGLPERSRVNGNYPVYGSNGVVFWHEKPLDLGPGIIIGRKGSIGTVEYSERDFWPIDTTFFIRAPKGIVDLRFLYWALKSSNLPSYGGSDSAVPGLNRNVLEKVRLFLPEIHEQKNIVQILDSIDQKIELNRRMNETLEKIGQALFKHYFIDNPDRKNWKTIKLSGMVKIFSGFAFSSKDFSNEGYGLVTIKNVQDGSFNPRCTNFIEVGNNKIPKNVFLNSGDIILSLTGNVGRACYVYGQETYLLNQRVARLVPIREADLPFTYFAFRQKRFQDYLISISRGTAQQNLSPVDLSRTIINDPPQDLSRNFYSIAGPIFERLAANMNEVNMLTNLRDSLLPGLISGRINYEI
jgi:type I restriction enzyme S subunit